MLENSTILLVRHGEKPADPCVPDKKGDDPNLSPLGEARAQKYITYFQTYFAQTVDKSYQTQIKLDYLFAAADSGSSARPVETLSPLAAATGLPFCTKIADASYPDLVSCLQTQTYVGKNILVCWHHGEIMQLANLLLTAGGQQGPTLTPANTWPGTWLCCVFGWVLQIRYNGSGAAMADWTRCINENLMADDTIDPPGSPEDCAP